MEIQSSFIRELAESQNATMLKEATCCKRRYSICLPTGTRVTASGLNHFLMMDAQNQAVLDILHIQECFRLPKMEVRLLNTPALTIHPKTSTMFSRSILVKNEHDIPVLKIRQPILGLHYKILGDNDTEIGSITRDWFEWEVQYPGDLDVRYKAALLASCIYLDFRNQRRR